mgnify:CR=1 FL=1
MTRGFDLVDLLSRSFTQWGIDACMEVEDDSVKVTDANGVGFRVRPVRGEAARFPTSPSWAIESTEGALFKEERAISGLLLTLRRQFDPGFEPGRAYIGARFDGGADST